MAWVRGVAHTDRPACVSPVLSEMGRSLNDILPDDLRQQLIPLIPDLPGTTGDGHDETRAYMALDWLIRTWLPAWLDLVPACQADAARVRDLGRIVDLASAGRAKPVVRAAQASAAAAEAAAWAAAPAAARDAAEDAAWVAAREATPAAAEAAAWAAAPAAARDAAEDAARDAAEVAAWVAAWVAAEAAARDATPAAVRRLWAAAREHLAATVALLQQSGIELYGRMARVGRDADATGELP